MAHSFIHFENPHTGKIRLAPVGFSWTVLFFNFFPALFRGHWAGFAILLLVALLTEGLSALIFMFFYNKMYIKHLIADGYKAQHATADFDYLEKELRLKIPRLA